MPLSRVTGIALALFLIGLFLSYRLVEVPPGLTVDEAAFGYNGVLLAETGRDQNGKFLPFFVHSIEGQDWRQPVTQYFIAGFFKLFGVSYFKLRLTSVLVTLVSMASLFYLVNKLLGKTAAVISSFVFLTTPIILIQSHMALDNIMPIPFVLLWLIFLSLWEKTKNPKYLIFSGIALGISFYSYKAMRAIVPILALTTLGYRRSAAFILGLAPFLLIIPYLQKEYPGAIFGGATLSFDSIYSFLYPYLSSFDSSFLFIRGDQTLFHSTGTHGMFLASSLPLFIIGLYQAIGKKKIWWLVIASFFLAPLLFGTVGSVHRASRLLTLVPLYALLSGLGGAWLLEKAAGKKFLLLILVLMAVNFADFTNYYWFKYPKVVQSDFSSTEEENYVVLSSVAKEKNLIPYIDANVYKSDGEIAHFLEAAFFDEPLVLWSDVAGNPGPGTILMSIREEIPGLKRLDIDLPNYHLFVNDK